MLPKYDILLIWRWAKKWRWTQGRCRSSGASEETHFCNFSSSIDFLIVRIETYKSSRTLLWLPMLTSAEGFIFKVMLSTGFFFVIIGFLICCF